jgi:hypothetical protein
MANYLGGCMMWIMVLSDIVTHPIFRVGVPLLLAIIIYLLVRQKTVWPVLVYAITNLGLDLFWQWYKSPLNCPLGKICTPRLTYNELWLPFVVVVIIGVVLVAWIATSLHKIANNLEGK